MQRCSDEAPLVRLKRQTAKIEAGGVYLPEQARWLDELRAELLAFPKGLRLDLAGAQLDVPAPMRNRHSPLLVNAIVGR